MSVRPATLSGPRTPARGPAGATAIVAALAGAGTRVLFGVPGGGPNLDVVGAAGAAGLRFVLTHTETAAAIMAATSADLTGTPGAVLVTRGPGLASAVNGIAHAALDRLPLVVIADTVRAAEAGRVSHQRLDQRALGGPVAKAVLTIGGGQAGQTAAQAVRRALAAPPGPVIALMDDGAPAAGPAPDPDGEHPDRGRPRWGSREGSDAEGPDAEGRARASDLGPLATALGQARRPVLLLGAQAVAHTAAIRAAVAGRGIPALHTYRARGIVPDTGGRSGRAGHRRHDGVAAAGSRRPHRRPGGGRGRDDPGGLGLPRAHGAGQRVAGPAHGHGTHGHGPHRRYQLLHRRDHPDRPAARGDRSARGLDPGHRAALGARRRPGRPGRGRPRAGRGRPRRSRHAGPAAGGHGGAGAHPAGHDRHRGRGRAHAGGDAAVGSGPAAPAAHLQRPGHHGLRAARRHRRGAVFPRPAGSGLHRGRRPGHDAGRNRDRRPAQAADRGHRVQRRHAQPHQDQAAAGRPGRRRGRGLRPGLLRRGGHRDGGRGRSGRHRGRS